MAKISTGLAVVTGFLFLMLKIKNNEIEELKEENKAKEKKIEINNTIEKASIKAEKDEETKKSDIDDSNWRHNI